MRKVSFNSLIVFSIMAIIANLPVYSQVRNWNTASRERAQVLNSAAITALLKGDQKTAVNTLHLAINADPSDPAPYATLGLALTKEKNYSVARDMLGKSYEIKHNPETLLTLGFVYYLEHDYDAALGAWQRALKLEPTCAEIYGDMGYAYLRKGQFDQAQESFQQLIKRRPNSQLAYQGLALLRYLFGDLAGAKQAAEHAQSISSYHPLLLLLAKINFLQGNKQVAESYVRELLAQKGKKVTVRSMTAFGYSKQRDFHFDPLLADSFDNGNLLLARTQMLPKNEGKRKSLAAQGKVNDAISAAASACSAAPSDFYLLRELALLEIAAGNYEQSCERFSRLLKLCPQCVVDWLHLGRSQFLLGKNAEAAVSVKEYLNKCPGQKISPVFSALAETVAKPANIQPEKLTPSSGASVKPADDTGF